MSTPNESEPVKKPGATPPAKGSATPNGAGDGKTAPPRPTAANRAGQGGAAAGKPAPAKPAPAKAAGKSAIPARKPTPVKASTAGSARTKTRKLGQIFVDLGFIDDAQQEELVAEIQVTGQRIGHAAVTRGWVNDDQLIQALAEQFGLRVANLDEIVPQREAI